MIYLTRRFDFCSAHRAYVPTLSEEENMKIFGVEALPEGHGHNYTLEVTIRGNTDPATGLVINLTDIKNLINTAVIDELDHKYLNNLAHFAGINPTLENLAKVVWKLADNAIRPYPYCTLDRIKLLEGRDAWIEYDGKGI